METERNWGSEPGRQPALADGDEMVRSECGRIVFNIDYRSHWFVLVKGTYSTALLVKHGGGEERVNLPRCNANHLQRIIASLNSDDAYLLMHQIYDVHRDAAKAAKDETAAVYLAAFAAGTLKKRKLPARGTVKVWIEPVSSTR